nr:homolog of EHV2 ORF24 protein UL87 [Macronycteris gammaherpesvirus 1]
MDPTQTVLLYVHNMCNPKVNNLNSSLKEVFSFQVDIFSCLALNKPLGGFVANLECLDEAIKLEPVFYTCRALRRLLLGVCWYPVVSKVSKVVTVQGESYEGPGLIISSTGLHTNPKIETKTYIQTVYSLEATDNLESQSLRAIASNTISFTEINYQTMFRIIARYISMQQFEACFTSFFHSIQANKFLSGKCTKNYYNLLSHLKTPILTYIPPMTKDHQEQFYMFNVQSFVNDWPNLKILSQVKHQIIINLKKYPCALISMCQIPPDSEITITTPKFIEYQILLNTILSKYLVKTYKKNPGNKPLKVFVKTDVSTQKWFTYPLNVSIYRIAMCMAVMDATNRELIQHTGKPYTEEPTLSQAVVSMFNKMKYASRERKATVSLKPPINLAQPSCHTNALLNHFNPVNSLSVYDFGVNIFNTNMVINTKIICQKNTKRYKFILDVPRLTNNFVVKKYSVKEPSFTVSVFYSDKSCISTAINVNISGDFLNFLFAMGNIRCFLPIETILPISIANWNSTLDLQGLENQHLVRSGRNDVFWTTNFPSAVSTKKGINVSWFKAATATISKVHGKSLVNQIHNELIPILTNKTARINKTKNSLFYSIEYRNRAQIQTIHKRFLECLYECSSFLRLNVKTLLKIANRGYFDFSKRIISHTKNKHECAVLGYKRCNLIPKVLHLKKKVRLDELGRNANFMTFMSSNNTDNNYKKIKVLIVRHMIRTFGLSWKLQRLKM